MSKTFLDKLLILNVYAFPFATTAIVTLILIEASTYPGFVDNYMFLGVDFLFILLIISGLFANGTMRVVSISESWTSYYRLLSQLNKLFLPALLVVGYIFISLESKNYRGFVYTHGFHFDPLYFFYLYVISGFLLVNDILGRREYNTAEKRMEIVSYSKKHFAALAALAILGWLSIYNVFDVFKDAFPRMTVILKHPFADQDWKMRFMHEDFYDFMMFVNQHTPENAVIMRMPQQGKWPSLSNDGYVRRFIYPRFTKAGNETNLNDPEIKYVFIHRSYAPPRVDKYIESWPTFKVPAKRVLYMRNNNYQEPPIIVEGDYDPQDETYDANWGLIELKR